MWAFRRYQSQTKANFFVLSRLLSSVPCIYLSHIIGSLLGWQWKFSGLPWHFHSWLYQSCWSMYQSFNTWQLLCIKAFIHKSCHDQSFDTDKSGNVMVSQKNFTVGSTLININLWPGLVKDFSALGKCSRQRACINLTCTFDTSSSCSFQIF